MNKKRKRTMKETYFVPVTLDNEIAGDEYYEVDIQVVKRKCGDMFFLFQMGLAKKVSVKKVGEE